MSQKETERGLEELKNIIKELGKANNLGTKVNPCDEVLPGVFVGDRTAATSIQLLKELGISHILNAAEGTGIGLVDTGRRYYQEQGLQVTYLGLPVLDLPQADITRHFQQVTEFIQAAVTGGGKVLVHCVFGVSRSATCVMAYLMLTAGMSASEALRLLLKRRQIVRPNDGFLRQLLQLETTMSKRDKSLRNCSCCGSPCSDTRQVSRRPGQKLKQDEVNNKTIASGPFDFASDDELIPYPRPPPSVELRSGVLISGCQCVKRDGLQHDCPRTGCQGRAHCMAYPAPVCVPSGNAPFLPLETPGTPTGYPGAYYEYERRSGKGPRRQGDLTPRGSHQDADYVRLARRGYVENPPVRQSTEKRVPCREHRKIRA